MSKENDSRDLSFCQVHSPLHRLVVALRGEGETDDARIGCVVVRAYPWATACDVVDAVMETEPPVMPRGWRRGMFAGRAAEAAVRRRA